MTLVGWCCMLSNVVLLAYYDPDMTSAQDEAKGQPRIPSWVWLWAAVAQHLGHTLDGCDGIQARRTGSSSPIGETGTLMGGVGQWSTVETTKAPLPSSWA